MLPTNDFLLAITDICHNFMPNRRYDTVAIGAVGLSLFKVKLVLGINSAVFNEVRLTKDRIVSPVIRHNVLIKKLNMEVLQEPYHAENSIVLYAKEQNLKIFGLASSRKICDECRLFMQRYINVFDTDCMSVDAWQKGGKLLTQAERKAITTLDSPTLNEAIAVRES
ncbi:hypothetical protein [Vibrio paucivorans]